MVIYDPRPEIGVTAAAAGFRVAESAVAAATGATVVMTSLPTPAIVEATLAGTPELLAALAPGALVVDLSTIDPATTRRIADAVTAAGHRFVDAPVTGSVDRAVAATLTIMVGATEADFAAAAAVLRHLGTPHRIGAVGSGQMMKLCNNMLLGVSMVALAEVIAAGARAGLDPAQIGRILATGSGGSWPVEHWLPKTVFRDDYEPRFALDLLAKDVGLFCRSAAESGAPAPVSALTGQVLTAARAEGLGGLDMAAVFKLYERWAVAPATAGAGA